MASNTIRAQEKYRNYKHEKLRRRNHDNIKRFQRATENTIRFQSYSVGNVVDLNKKTFSKESFKF